MLTSRRAALALGESSDSSSLSDPFLASSLDPTRFVPFESEQSVPDKLAQLEFEEGTDYRSIAGLVKPADLEPADESEEDDLFGGAGITGGESQDDYLKRRNLELDRALRESPKNVALWLEFVDFQDEVALTSFMGGSAKRALSKVERTSTSEIKLSILDRALAVAGNQDSEALLLAYLRAASDVWDPKKVLYRWGETLRSHPKLTGLWIEYVSWRQTSWANFGVREVVEVFEESFRVLVAAAEKEELGSNGESRIGRLALIPIVFRSRDASLYRSRNARRQLDLPLPAIVLDASSSRSVALTENRGTLSSFRASTGFSERALAAFQALIELN
mgnify:FL=1